MSISWKTSTGSSATSKEPRANRFFLDLANLEALWNRVFEGATNRGTGARQQIGQRPAVGRHQFRHLPPRNPFEPDFAADARRQLFSACACGQRSRGSFHCCGGISGRGNRSPAIWRAPGFSSRLTNLLTVAERFGVPMLLLVSYVGSVADKHNSFHLDRSRRSLLQSDHRGNRIITHRAFPIAQPSKTLPIPLSKCR